MPSCKASVGSSTPTLLFLDLRTHGGGIKWPRAGAILADHYSLAWRTMDAQHWGVPQRRLRISLVLDLTGGRAGEVLFEPESLRGHFAPGVTAGQATAGAVENGAGTADRVYAEVSNVCAFKLGNSEQARSIGYAEELAPTLNAECGGNKPTCAYTLKIRSGCEGPGRADSLGRVIAQPVGADLYNGTLTGDKAVTLITATGQGGANTGPSVIEKIVRWIVRRITPTECERLQGYPDGWTDLGEWVDSKGKAHKAADTPRYKALGNSIALPQWYYVLGGIADRLPEDATLGSLFDGIGGFPYVWAQLHAGRKELCVWASEIEEFPIAVTKKWFPEVEDGKLF